MKAIVKKQWFLFGLILVFILVIGDTSGTLANAGIFLKAHNGSSVMIFLIFLASGMIIEFDQIRAGIRDVRATSAALFCIVFAAPLAALILTRLPLEQGVAVGLILVSVVPTTLSSGVVMTGQSGGNMAHALFVTILSNCVAILSIPLFLPWMVSGMRSSNGIHIDQTAIFIKLILLVLLPLMVGLALKKTVFTISPAVKKKLGIINQCIVLCIVYMSLSGARQVLIDRSAVVFWILPLVMSFHFILLAAAWGMAGVLKIGPGRRESVLFMGGQKTLPLAVMLQITCFPGLGTALPVCVLHHIIHLMIDSYIATRMGAAKN